jgi:hypothetical protein
MHCIDNCDECLIQCNEDCNGDCEKCPDFPCKELRR